MSVSCENATLEVSHLARGTDSCLTQPGGPSKPSFQGLVPQFLLTKEFESIVTSRYEMAEGFSEERWLIVNGARSGVFVRDLHQVEPLGRRGDTGPSPIAGG